MVFAVSEAKREILRKLAEDDWTPTDLAEKLGKSPSGVYNHLDDLRRRGVVSKRQIAGKTRPETEYSVGPGFVQYVAVLPEGFSEGTVSVTPEKRATLQIWSLPQAEFHPFVERYWWTLRQHADIDFTAIVAVAVYGLVARGTADQNSDIDVLVITCDRETATTVESEMGTLRLRTEAGTRIALAETYSVDEYRESVTSGSDFLGSIRDELHVIYDPERVFRNPEVTSDE